MPTPWKEDIVKRLIEPLEVRLDATQPVETALAIRRMMTERAEAAEEIMRLQTELNALHKRNR